MPFSNSMGAGPEAAKIISAMKILTYIVKLPSKRD